uniref:AAA family ATPase n=1 Tax=Azospirillum sp. SYSU D00513 TaxID=2812561 RepID=UPI001A977B94
MAFKRVNANARPPRRWALKGFAGDGKSHFLLAMQQPCLMIDADGRRHELKGGDLFELSAEPTDHRSVERIQDLLAANLPGSGIRTIAVDSLSALIGASISRSMLDNVAGRNTNKNQAWVDKAERMRLLQDAITGFGTDVVFVWHLEKGQLSGKERTRETLPEIERERLKRSLNASLRIVRDRDRRGVLVEWSREGPAGMVVWDTEGFWKGVPERIEEAIYGTAAAGQGQTSGAHDGVHAIPANVVNFRSVTEAVTWSVEQGAYDTVEEAQAAYAELRARLEPKSARPHVPAEVRVARLTLCRNRGLRWVGRRRA